MVTVNDLYCRHGTGDGDVKFYHNSNRAGLMLIIINHAITNPIQMPIEYQIDVPK